MVRVIASHLQREAEHSWSTCDFDFTGCVLENTRFGGATFSGKYTHFDRATFSGKHIWFNGATFSGMYTWFDGATFKGKSTTFDGANFSGGIISFKEPKAWNPAPRFDWDPQVKDPVAPKPANVKPADWPPQVILDDAP